MAHCYVFGEGGTGMRILLAIYVMLSSLAYRKNSPGEIWKMICEAMDAGAAEIEELQGLQKADQLTGFRVPSCPFTLLKLAEKVRLWLQKTEENGGKMTAARVVPDWFEEELILAREQLDQDILGGYYGDLTLGSTISAVAVECALKTKEDKISGFQAVAEDVVASSNAYEVRVAFCGKGNGGEGRQNLCTHPALLKKLCVSQAMEKLQLQPEQAEEYVDRNLKIAVVMIGNAFRFPDTEGLPQNTADLVAGTMKNYPADSADAVNIFCLLEHDCCPVQAERSIKYGNQEKHAHAIELVAVAAIENFFSRETVTQKQCLMIPRYSLPGRTLTNWDNLGLPEKYRLALSARLRFDAALFYWVRPQLLVSDEERNAGRLYESEILARMYKAKTPEQLEAAMDASGLDLDRDIIAPLKALLNKETLFLEYLRDISLTGKNWETGVMPSPECGADLFDVSRIEHMLNHGDIRDYGGMTGFQLDELTVCPMSRNNLYHTRLTMAKVRDRVDYRPGGKPGTLLEILGAICDVCSDGKEKRVLWHF